MGRKPFYNKPHVSFAKRKRTGNQVYLSKPSKDKVGKGKTVVERHQYTFELPKKRRFSQENGDELANKVDAIYKFLERRYGDTVDGAGYTIEGKGALDLNNKGRPDWERNPVQLHRNLMAISKSKRDAEGRLRAYGNNEFSGLLNTPGFKATKSKPVFFKPARISVTVISKPNQRLKHFKAPSNWSGNPARVKAPWENNEKKSQKPARPKSPRHKR